MINEKIKEIKRIEEYIESLISKIENDLTNFDKKTEKIQDLLKSLEVRQRGRPTLYSIKLRDLRKLNLPNFDLIELKGSLPWEPKKSKNEHWRLYEQLVDFLLKGLNLSLLKIKTHDRTAIRAFASLLTKKDKKIELKKLQPYFNEFENAYENRLSLQKQSNELDIYKADNRLKNAIENVMKAINNELEDKNDSQTHSQRRKSI